MKTFNATLYLEGKHTRQLLDLLQCCRRCGGRYDVLDNNSDWFVSISQVKAELAKREHIPNKLEAKKLRQERAKFC